MINGNMIGVAFLFATILGTASGVFSQDVQIKGVVYDTSAHKAVNEASIVILNARDSFLIADTRSNKDGLFEFNNISRGKYLLLVTYPRYAAYVEAFLIDTLSSKIDFKTISLQLKSILLKEFIVGGERSAIRFKGDTTEYTADSFYVPPNASVEDLIKQLPGLQVDRNGQIKANGRAVEKVLVDGEEFFSDDPTLVTRNLKADMIDKVQLYDKSSDKAAFTGIDDGKKTGTLNLKLKENKKNGYFGKVEVGGGSEGFYQNQAMFNSFQGKRKFAAYFTFSNTGLIGLDRQSQQSYAGGDSNPIENDLDKWNGTYEGIGIPKSISGGLHYDNRWNNDNQYININYKLGGLDIVGEQNSITQNNLPGNVFYSVSRQHTRNQMIRHGLNTTYEVKTDSSSLLKMSIEGSLLNKNVDETNISATKRENGSDLNNSERSTAVDAAVKAFNAEILWEKKFKRDRRTLSLNFNTAINNNNSDGYFFTVNNFFDESSVKDSSKIVDQYKTTRNYAETYSLKLVYTEPLSKYGSLVVNYGIFINNAKAELLSFNKASTNIYTNLDSLYSNNYNFDQFAIRGGLAYVYNKKKIRFQLGNDIARNQFNQQNLFNRSVLKRSFTNWYPSAQFVYQFSPSKTISLNYNGNTIQPGILQIQPVANNNDPLNIFIGNNNLKPVFSNDLSVSYQAFNDKNSGYLGINGNFSIINSPITTSVQTDSTSGINTYTYVNLPDKKQTNYSANIFYSAKTNIWSLNFGINTGFKGARYASVANSEINITNVNTYELSFILSKQNPRLYNVGIGIGPDYNTNKSSLQPLINNNSWGYMVSFNIDLFLPRDFLIHTEGDYKWQGKTQTFTDNFSRFLWNASIGKKILKNKNLLFKLSANDILNQNIGFGRNVNANVIYQNSYTTISHYFMASIIWDFNKTTEK